MEFANASGHLWIAAGCPESIRVIQLESFVLEFFDLVNQMLTRSTPNLIQSANPFDHIATVFTSPSFNRSVYWRSIVRIPERRDRPNASQSSKSKHSIARRWSICRAASLYDSSCSRILLLVMACQL